MAVQRRAARHPGLRITPVHLRTGFTPCPLVPHVADDSDDLSPLVVEAADRDSFADRVFIGEVASLQRLVDYDDARSLPFILPDKFAAFDQGDLHRLKISGADYSVIHHRRLTRLLRLPFDGEGPDGIHPGERRRV